MQSNLGQADVAGAAKALGDGVGDPFAHGTLHGPQVSQIQFDVRLYPRPFFLTSQPGYISVLWDTSMEGKRKVPRSILGERLGQEGYFIQPTIFTECKPEMKIWISGASSWTGIRQ